MSVRPEPGDVVWSGHAHTRHHKVHSSASNSVVTLCGLWMFQPRASRAPDGYERACRTCLRIEKQRAAQEAQ